MIAETLDRSQNASELHRNIAALFDQANIYLAPKRLRRYQADISSAGAFYLSDPRNGLAAHCTGTLYSSPKAFSYQFDGADGQFWLLTSTIAQGYALCVAYFPESKTCIVDHSFIDAGHVSYRVENISNLDVADEICSNPEVVIGHTNFAHFAWNELSALLELEQRSELKPARLFVVSEPILAIEDLMDTGKHEVVRGYEGQLKPNQSYLHRKVLYCPGSELLTRVTQARITERCAHRRPLNIINATINGTFTVWISLRILYRRAINEIDVYLIIIKDLMEKFPDIYFILDGYSTPDDLYVNGRHNISNERNLQMGTSALAQNLISKFEGDELKRIIDITGADLPSAISIASSADVYLCHHGTQQHKIGWFYAVPGVIHAGKSIAAIDPAEWVRNQSEVALLPRYVPANFIGECASPDNSRQHMPYFSDYCFNEAAVSAHYIKEIILKEYSLWNMRTT